MKEFIGEFHGYVFIVRADSLEEAMQLASKCTIQRSNEEKFRKYALSPNNWHEVQPDEKGIIFSVDCWDY